MFEDLFKKFKKRRLNSLKSLEEIESDWEKMKLEYASVGSSDLYLLIKEYFLTRAEMNRDVMEELNIDDKAQLAKIRKAQAENQVIYNFINDIEGMMQSLQSES